MIKVVARDSAERRQLAWSPRVDVDGVAHVALLSDAGRRSSVSHQRNLVATALGETFVVVRLVPASALARPGWVRRWAAAVRAPTLVQSLLPATIGAGVAGASVWGAVVVAGVVAAHAGANLVASAYDHVMGDGPIDRHGAATAVARGWISARRALSVGAAALAVALGVGVWVVVEQPSVGLLAVGLAALALGWQWSAPPLRWGRTALADLVLPAIFGPALAGGAAFAVSGRLDEFALGFGAVAALGVFARRLARTARRIPEDTFAGRSTVARALGFGRTKWLLYGVYAAMWVAPIALVTAREGAWEATLRGLGLALPMTLFAAAIFAVHVARRVQRASAPHHPALRAAERVWVGWHWAWAALVLVWAR